MIRALRDVDGANLDRVQVIKGWLDAQGKTHEQVYDVVWSGNRKPGANGKLPPVGNTVNVPDASYKNTIGAPMLLGYWKDPTFNPKERAFYYVRVIEIPTPRWTTYDAKIFHVKLPRRHPRPSRTAPTLRRYGTRREVTPPASTELPELKCSIH